MRRAARTRSGRVRRRRGPQRAGVGGGGETGGESDSQHGCSHATASRPLAPERSPVGAAGVGVTQRGRRVEQASIDRVHGGSFRRTSAGLPTCIDHMASSRAARASVPARMSVRSSAPNARPSGGHWRCETMSFVGPAQRVAGRGPGGCCDAGCDAPRVRSVECGGRPSQQCGDRGEAVRVRTDRRVACLGVAPQAGRNEPPRPGRPGAAADRAAARQRRGGQSAGGVGRVRRPWCGADAAGRDGASTPSGDDHRCRWCGQDAAGDRGGSVPDGGGRRVGCGSSI